MVELSGTSTAGNRRHSGMVTGAAVLTRARAARSPWRRQAAAAAVPRGSNACGLMATPHVAAVWVSASTVARGLPLPPHTKGWLTVPPLRGEVRGTHRVLRPAVTAVVVTISRIVRATGGRVVLGKLLVGRHDGVCRSPLMP